MPTTSATPTTRVHQRVRYRRLLVTAIVAGAAFAAAVLLEWGAEETEPLVIAQRPTEVPGQFDLDFRPDDGLLHNDELRRRAIDLQLAELALARDLTGKPR